MSTAEHRSATTESSEEEGPAFMSFSGLPDEDVEEFVNSVDSLRKSFNWTGQVAYCYARTMIKGTARKLLKTLGGNAEDDDVGALSWQGLKNTLLYEYSARFATERKLRALLSIRQIQGENGSEYAERFIESVNELLETHSFDTHVLAVLFTQGLRNERTRLQLTMRRPDSFDKAVSYVAPDQIARLAKIAPMLSPTPSFVPASPSAPLDPHSRPDSRLEARTVAHTGDALGLHTATPRAHSRADSPYESTANGATFSLDDAADFRPRAQSSSPWPATAPRHSTEQPARRPRNTVNVTDMQFWAPASTLPRQTAPARTGIPQALFDIGRGSDDEGDKFTSAADLNSLADQLEQLSVMFRVQSDARRRRPRLCYRCRQKGHLAADCPLPDDVVVPNQQQREKLAAHAPPERYSTLARSNSIATDYAFRSSRAEPHAFGGADGAATVGRRRNANGRYRQSRHQKQNSK